ncbi:MAG TPA: hypothetical protein VFN97_04055 [Actinospica sp.]|nr:hypothetical protein [Actinospica sp.]
MSAMRPSILGVAGALTLALTATLSACTTAPRPTAADAARQSRAAESPTPRHAVTPTAVPVADHPCTAADLTLTPARRTVTNGVQIERFTLTPATPAPACTLKGAPNIVPKGPLSAQVHGQLVDLALSQQDLPDDLDITPPQPTTVPLTPGKSASFYLAWFDASPVVCVQGSALGLNAPGDTTYADMRVLTYPIGAICDGLFYVSSVF